MKKAKILAIGAIAAVIISVASVTVFAAPSFRRSNMQNNNCPNTSAVCDGTAKQNCTLTETCPYYNDNAQENGTQKQAQQGRGQGKGRANGQGRMGNRSGVCARA